MFIRSFRCSSDISMMISAISLRQNSFPLFIAFKNSNFLYIFCLFSPASSPSMPVGPPGELNQKYAYQITVNENYSHHDDTEEDKPPVLPPRNYRSSDRFKGRAVPEPRPSREKTNSPKGITQVNVSQGRPPMPEPRTSQEGSGQKHVSQVNVSFNSEFDATPKADSYADQLRQQARRISQSQSSLLSAARYQPKVLSETKTSISVSRPVDKPPKAQEARVPHTTEPRLSQESESRLSQAPESKLSHASESRHSQAPEGGVEGHEDSASDVTYTSTWTGGSSDMDTSHVSPASELTLTPVTVITSKTAPHSQVNHSQTTSQTPHSQNTSSQAPHSQNTSSYSHSHSYSPSYSSQSVMNISATSHQSSLAQSPSVSQNTSVTSVSQSPLSLAGTSFDSTTSSASPRSVDIHQGSAVEHLLEVVKTTKTKPVVGEKKKKKKKEVKTTPPKPKRLQETLFTDVMTPPPPPPPKHTSPPDSRLIDKPLPPPPPDVLELSNGDSSANENTPTSR